MYRDRNRDRAGWRGRNFDQKLRDLETRKFNSQQTGALLGLEIIQRKDMMQKEIKRFFFLK